MIIYGVPIYLKTKNRWIDSGYIIVDEKNAEKAVQKAIKVATELYSGAAVGANADGVIEIELTFN